MVYDTKLQNQAVFYRLLIIYWSEKEIQKGAILIY